MVLAGQNFLFDTIAVTYYIVIKQLNQKRDKSLHKTFTTLRRTMYSV